MDPRRKPLYSPASVAALLDMHPSTARSWLRGRLLDVPGDASFLDLVELHIFRELQAKFGFSTRKLRAMLDRAREVHGVRHPLAMKRILVEHDRLWLPLEASRAGGAQHYVDLKEDAQQLGIREVVMHVAENLEFARSDALAERWWMFGHEGGVVVDPSVRWGQPVIAETRVPVDAVFAAVEAEGSVARAAWALDLDEDVVAVVVRAAGRLAA